MANKSLKPVKKSDDAGNAAGLLEEQELREEVSQTISTGVSLADNEEETVHELLCGYTDSDGVKHTTYTIREMTGRDEEAISKPDIRQNPAKALNVLLSRCVTSLGTLTRKDFKSTREWEDVIKSLYSGDQDMILMQLRKISVSDTLEIQHTCPNCKAKLNTTMSIDELEIIPFKGEEVIHFTLSKGYKDKNGEVHTDGTMRLTNGLDREILTPLARKNLAKANTILLTRVCKFDDGLRVDEDVMAGLTMRDRDYLSALLAEHNFGYNLSVEVECDQCGEIFTGALNAVNFLS